MVLLSNATGINASASASNRASSSSRSVSISSLLLMAPRRMQQTVFPVPSVQTAAADDSQHHENNDNDDTDKSTINDNEEDQANNDSNASNHQEMDLEDCLEAWQELSSLTVQVGKKLIATQIEIARRKRKQTLMSSNGAPTSTATTARTTLSSSSSGSDNSDERNNSSCKNEEDGVHEDGSSNNNNNKRRRVSSSSSSSSSVAASSPAVWKNVPSSNLLQHSLEHSSSAKNIHRRNHDNDIVKIRSMANLLRQVCWQQAVLERDIRHTLQLERDTRQQQQHIGFVVFGETSHVAHQGDTEEEQRALDVFAGPQPDNE